MREKKKNSDSNRQPLSIKALASSKTCERSGAMLFVLAWQVA